MVQDLCNQTYLVPQGWFFDPVHLNIQPLIWVNYSHQTAVFDGDCFRECPLDNAPKQLWFWLIIVTF